MAATGQRPKRANGGGTGSGAGKAASSTPVWSRPRRAWMRPQGSTTAETPVLAARASGRPSSIARIRAMARCW